MISLLLVASMCSYATKKSTRPTVLSCTMIWRSCCWILWGKYLLKDTSQFAYDHVKGCFDALKMLNGIIKQSYKAKLSSAMSLRIAFVHA
ncbi:hypothetical protein BD560DRAFT_467221 [Blakeslea trispora]|nr:hypothetical protein BD560DRAFT_467221 [Blakeslea trispora]